MSGNFYRNIGKRIFDLTICFPGMIIILPLILILSLLILILDGKPVFYKQTRVGKGFKEFKFFKFRSMVKNADNLGPGITKDNDKRITPIGRILRKTKLDEFPQILNVIRGEISIIGPRPELPEYVQQFQKDYQKILTIKPGIADFATLEFHDEESNLKGFEDVRDGYITKILPQKIKLYKKYIESISFKTDLIILFKTLRNLIS